MLQYCCHLNLPESSSKSAKRQNKTQLNNCPVQEIKESKPVQVLDHSSFEKVTA